MIKFLHSPQLSPQRSKLPQNASSVSWGLLAASGLLLAGCNVLNPSDAGDYPDDADTHVELGRRALQDQEFAKAHDEFTKALAEDSTKSKAYQGLAKAELGVDTFEISALVKLADDIGKANDDKKIEILSHQTPQWFNHIYKPLMRVAGIYTTLSRRDSLGLTDGKFPRHLIRTELSTILNNQSYFLLIDLPSIPDPAHPGRKIRDTVISQNELAAIQLMALGSNGLTFNTNSLTTRQENGHTVLDNTQATNINNLLSNVDAIKNDSTLMKQLMGVASSTGNDPTADVAGQARQFLEDLGSATSYYMINDSLDNDGDGCINEETGANGIDEDGDGLVDEDSHVFWFPPLKLSLVGDSLRAVARANPDTSWIDTAGRLRHPHWVSIMDSGNAAIYDSIQTAHASDEPAKKMNGEQLRTATILEIRRRVLALNGRDRVIYGRKHVGGCWDHIWESMNDAH